LQTGINLIGFASGNIGLGAGLRHIVHAMRERGQPYAIFDMDPGLGRKGHEAEFQREAVPSLEALPYDINFLVMPPGTVRYQLERLAPALARPRVLNAVQFVWELTVLPERWKRALQLFDAVVGMSQFVCGVLDASLAGPTVISGLQPVELPQGVVADRARFGFPSDVFVFISSFDPLSDVARKNPHAVLEAFRRAFPPAERGVRLVFKINALSGPARTPEVDRFMAEFRALAAADDRVLLVAESLPFRDVLSMYASADVFVSLHRSEGFGLGLLEAMALGRPVIATAWSGNRTFMTWHDSCLVGYEFVPVRASLSTYATELRGLEPYWAEPSVDEAAAWMRRLAGDRAFAAAMGRRAHAAYLAYRERAGKLQFVDELLALREHRRAAPPPAREPMQQRINEVLRFAAREEFTVAGWVGEQYGRHIGWRFRRQGNAGE